MIPASLSIRQIHKTTLRRTIMDRDFIKVIRARQNNLKDITIKIPKRKITVFTGVSGSGKSSLVFGTIAQEAGRQLNETFPAFTRSFLPRYNRPDADQIQNLSTAIVVDQKRIGGNSRSTLGTITDIQPILRLLFSRFAAPPLGYSNQYSFNDPAGMCPTCEGIGQIMGLDRDTALNLDKSLNEGAILLPNYTIGSWFWKQIVNPGFFDPDKKLKDYTEKEMNQLLYGEEKIIAVHQGEEFNTTYLGVAARFNRSNINTEKEQSEATKKKLEKYMKSVECPLCHGERFNQKVLNSKISDYNIHDLTAIQIEDLVEVLKTFDDPKMKPMIDTLVERIQNLVDIGLGYMKLNRETASLSGGESQRVKMVKSLTSGLTDVCYIFDEPSIGLHARDVHRLNNMLEKLRDKGNTLLVVEHDPDVIKIADFVVDMGPKAGSKGGQVVCQGSYDELCQADTLTGRFIHEHLPIKPKPRVASSFIDSSKSSLHNLKDIFLHVPEGILTVVTGV